MELIKRNSWYVLTHFHFYYERSLEASIIQSFVKDEDEEILFTTSISEMEEQDYIKQRTKFKTNMWFEPWFQSRKKPLLTPWYKVDGIPEIITAINVWSCYRCCVIGKDDEFLNYNYLLSCSEDDSYGVLLIHPRNPDDFVNRVVPKIKKILPDLVIDSTV